MKGAGLQVFIAVIRKGVILRVDGIYAWMCVCLNINWVDF